MRGRIVILGAGITGLTAARTLEDNNYNDYMLYEKENFPGGLASTVTDEKGFVWDYGGHVFYYKDDLTHSYINRFVRDWKTHKRESFVVSDKYQVSYPFQQNLSQLDPDDRKICYDNWKNNSLASSSGTLPEWLNESYGKEINKLFTLPYNLKIWGDYYYDMSSDWARKSFPLVSEESFSKVQSNFGINNIFRYPLRGGAQSLALNIAENLKNKVHYNKNVCEINTLARKVLFNDGSVAEYDYLISTIPLDDLLLKVSGIPKDLKVLANCLKSKNILLVGAGIQKKSDFNFSWNYYPDKYFRPYRISRISSYSPFNCLESQTSFLAECVHEPDQDDYKMLAEEIIDSMIRLGLFSKKDLVSRFVKVINKAYPVPLLNREQTLLKVFPYLEQLNVFSRGRNGCWRYETGSIPDCINMGREIAERIIFLKEEKVVNQEY